MILHRIANIFARTHQLGQSGLYLLSSYSAAGAAILCSIRNFVRKSVFTLLLLGGWGNNFAGNWYELCQYLPLEAAI